MKSTICPDCGGDEFYPCASCHKAATKAHRRKESCHPAAEAYAKRHEMDVILSGHVDCESMTPEESKAFTGMIKAAITDIDKISPAEIAAEADQFRNEEELAYWKHRSRIFEVLNRAADGDLRDQMEITGRKEMELTKLRGEMRRMQQTIERLEGIIPATAINPSEGLGLADDMDADGVCPVCGAEAGHQCTGKDPRGTGMAIELGMYVHIERTVP